MTQDPSIRPDVARVAGATPDKAAAPKRSDGAAFKVLLERLEQQTQKLREDGTSLADPSELAGAVDRAKHSIDDAVSLSEELLEAYRAARHQAEGDEEIKP